MGIQISLDKTLNMDSIEADTLISIGDASKGYNSTSVKHQTNDEEYEILQRTSSTEDIFQTKRSAADAVLKEGDLITLLDKNTWQNPNSEVSFLSESLVLRYLESVVHFMKLIDENWGLQLIKCGAFYEGICTGLPLRFDYILEMTTVQVSELLMDESESLNKLTARFCGICYDTRGGEGQEGFVKLMQHIMTCMARYMHQNCHYNGLELLEVQDTKETPGLELFLQHKHHGIIVKLVPAVKFPPYCRAILPEYSEVMLQFVTKAIPGVTSRDQAREFITGNLHLIFSDFHSHFRISSAVLEMYIVRCLPEICKQPFRVLMYLCQTHLILPQSYNSNYHSRSVMLKLFGYKPFLPRYALKLLFLHHMMECYVQNEVHQGPGMYFNDKTGLIQTLIKDLKRLKYFIYLPVDSCVFMVDSLLFGNAHKHKFDFVQQLVYSRVSQNIGWFDHMINNMELLLDEEISQEDEMEYKKKFKGLNYPTPTNVQFYPRLL